MAFFATCSLQNEAVFRIFGTMILFFIKNGTPKMYLRQKNKWEKFLSLLRLVVFWKFGKSFIKFF